MNRKSYKKSRERSIKKIIESHDVIQFTEESGNVGSWILAQLITELFDF